MSGRWRKRRRRARSSLATSAASKPIDRRSAARRAPPAAARRADRARCATQYGAPWRMAIQRPSGSRASSVPVRPSRTLSASGMPTCGRSASATPSLRRMRVPLGPSLDAGAVLVEGRAAFQHVRGDAMARQGQRGREPADAAAGDEHRSAAGLGVHAPAPFRRSRWLADRAVARSSNYYGGEAATRPCCEER